MSISLEQVQKVAHLARIQINETQLAQLQQQLDGILHWIDQLQATDVTNVLPYTDLPGMSMPERVDEVTEGNCVEAVLSNAPESAHNMFSVPKVVE